jgi:hypothetical protein
VRLLILGGTSEARAPPANCSITPPDMVTADTPDKASPNGFGCLLRLNGSSEVAATHLLVAAGRRSGMPR